ncbi:MAG TPA: response regulator [Nitrospirae bacterium]|nr:response regulator [Nitrospirota bacterium]
MRRQQRSRGEKSLNIRMLQDTRRETDSDGGRGGRCDFVNKRPGSGLLRMPEQKLIMVVDDEAVVREVLCSYLELHGYRTVSRSDGLSAISCAKENMPDLVFLDIKMPGMDGIKTCNMFKKTLPSSPETGIIIITGYGSPENVEKSFVCGAIDVIKKPFDLEAINKRVNIWFELRSVFYDEFARRLVYRERVMEIFRT